MSSLIDVNKLNYDGSLVAFTDRYAGAPSELSDVAVLDCVGFRMQRFRNVPGGMRGIPEKQIWSAYRMVQLPFMQRNKWFPYPTIKEQAVRTKGSIWEFAADRAIDNDVGQWAEFGVMNGISARYFLSRLPQHRKLYLFDSFQGLPEDWGPHKAGHFAVKEIPKFDDERAIIKQGWFADTLPLDDLLGFVNIDCDLYSSCKEVLAGINVTAGSIIYFDELWGYQNWEQHEYRALMEWDRDWRFLARDKRYAAVIEIL